MDIVGIYIAIGAAAVLASIYFYYTVRYVRAYYDSEVPVIQLTTAPLHTPTIV